jgi:thiamine-monophosphate kinase
VDLLAEEVHFNLALTSSHFLGRKSLAANLSDIANIGARPRFALISLALPARISVEFADDSFCGYSEMPATYGVSPIGGLPLMPPIDYSSALLSGEREKGNPGAPFAAEAPVRS